MWRKLWPGLFSFLIYFPVLSQSYDALVKESIDMIQSVPGDSNSWRNQDRWTYSYDAHRQYVYARYDVWDTGENTWKETRRYNYEYDRSGNRIYDHTLFFDKNGDLLRDWEARRKYQGGLRVYTEIFNNDIENVTKEKTVTNYTFDTQERLILKKQEFQNNYNTHWIETTAYYFGPEGCQVAETTTRKTYFLDSYYIISDSTSTRYERDCLKKQEDFYTTNNSTGRYALYYKYKIDRKYDDQGYITSESFYESSPTQNDWWLSSMYSYENDSRGRPLITTYQNFNSGYKSVDYHDYDKNDQLIYESEKVWNDSRSEWMNSYDYQAEYEDDSLLSYFIYHFKWDSVSNTYVHYISATYNYDENNILTRKLESQKNTNVYNNKYYTQTVESVFNNRCDGENLSTVVTELESTNTYQILYPTKTVYVYYENALCDPERAEDSDLVLYPNPSRGNINIYNAETFGNSEISILNYKGDLVYRDERYLNNYFSLDLYGLPAGVYLLQIKNELVHTSRKFVLAD